MSDESTSTQAPAQSNDAPAAKPSFEDVFAKDDGSKSRLSSSLVKPKKLGISAFSEGADELTGKSKKSKSPLKSSTPKEEPQNDEMAVSFEPAPEETSLPVESKAKGEEPPKVEAKPQEKPKEMHKVKINGQEEEVDIEELKRGYQIRKASDKVFQEAANIRKDYESKMLKMKDPNMVGEVLQAFGHDPRKMAEEYLGQVLTFEMMTPEQKELAILKAKEARRDMEVKEAIRQRDMEKANAENQQRADHLQKSIIETLSKNEDLPKDSDTVRKIIQQMRTRIMAQQHLPEHLREDVTPESVLVDVKKAIEGELRTKVSQMNPKQLAEFLGKEKLDEYRKYELEQLKNPIPSSRPPVNGEDMAPVKKKHYKTMDEFRRNQEANGVKTFGGRFS